MDTLLKSIKISLHIPPQYLERPIIFELVSNYNLEVNITSALLGEYSEGDGWFNLLLRGTENAIKEALKYLVNLDIEVWTHNEQQQALIKHWNFEGWLLDG